MALADNAPAFLMKPNEPQATGTGLWEVSAKKSFKNSKKRKFDQPLKAKKPYTSKDGKIVKNNITQMVIEDTIPLNTTQEIAKEKEVIDIEDTDDMDILEKLGCENCEECGKNIAFCNCYDYDSDYKNYINAYNEYEDGTEKSIDMDDECSEDLFNI